MNKYLMNFIHIINFDRFKKYNNLNEYIISTPEKICIKYIMISKNCSTLKGKFDNLKY